MTHLYVHSFDISLGRLHAAVNRSGAVVRLSWADISSEYEPSEIEINKYACGELEYQLDQYFREERKTFTVPVYLSGTEFQQTVWNRLRKINFGETITYGTLARKVGRANAAQAVGNAVAVNPVVILVPCHRVIPSSNGIGNYARRYLGEEEGRSIKRSLLKLEKALHD